MELRPALIADLPPTAGAPPALAAGSRASQAVELASLVAAAIALTLLIVRLAPAVGLAWWLPIVVLAAGVVADLMSGVVHWIADTWGHESWPVIGPRLLRPFRVHHVNPDDMLGRGFLDLNGDVALLTLPLLATAWLLPTGVARRAGGGDVLHGLGGVGAAHQPGAPVGAHGPSAARRSAGCSARASSCRRRRTGSITRRRTRPTTASPPAGTTRGPPGPGSSPGSNGSSRGSPGWCRAPTRRRDEALALHAAHDRAAPLRHRLDQRRARRRARLHRPRRGGLLPLSVDLHRARAADAVSAGLHAGAPAPRAGRRLRVRRDQRHAPPEQGARRQRHRLRAGRGAARRLAGAGRRRADTGAVPRPRLVPAVADALLGDVRAARAALRPQAGTGRVPAGVAHRPDLLRDERAAAAAHDAADDGAGDGLLRLGGERPAAGLGVEPARRRPVPRDPRAHGRLPVPGSIAPSTACRCCGASTRSTTRPRRWTGSRARACTSSTWR